MDPSVKGGDHGIDRMAQAAEQAAQAGMRGAAKHWHQQFLPGHFQAGAASRYDYFRRKDRWAAKVRPGTATTWKGRLAKRWNAWKRKRWFHRAEERRLISPTPLRKTGALKRMAESRAAIGKAGQARISIGINVPWYVAANKRRTEMFREIGAVVSDERDKLNAVAAADCKEALARARRRLGILGD